MYHERLDLALEVKFLKVVLELDRSKAEAVRVELDENYLEELEPREIYERLKPLRHENEHTSKFDI